MKVVCRCINCNRIVRRSECYTVKLVGGYIDNSSQHEPPKLEKHEEVVKICKPCAVAGGYKDRRKENYENTEKLVN